MPTDEDNAGSEDTHEQPTDSGNAEEGTETPDELSEAKKLAEEAKKRESDARKKMDEAAIEAKKLRKENERLRKLALGEEVEEEEPEEKPEYLTKEEFNSVVKFELANDDKISLNREGYEDYRSKGYLPDDALRLAHLDKGITSDNMTDHLRQAQSSQGSASTDRSDVQEVPHEKAEEMKKWGYSKETYLKHKDKVERR